VASGVRTWVLKSNKMITSSDQKKSRISIFSVKSFSNSRNCVFSLLILTLNIYKFLRDLFPDFKKIINLIVFCPLFLFKKKYFVTSVIVY